MSKALPRVLHNAVPSSPLEICAINSFSTLGLFRSDLMSPFFKEVTKAIHSFKPDWRFAEICFQVALSEFLNPSYIFFSCAPLWCCYILKKYKSHWQDLSPNQVFQYGVHRFPRTFLVKSIYYSDFSSRKNHETWFFHTALKIISLLIVLIYLICL